MRIGKEIKRRRKRLKLTIRGLEKKSGVSNPFISQVENGRNISLETLRKLARGLDCTVSDLIGDR